MEYLNATFLFLTHHHRYRAEERFKIIRQFRSSCVSRIHRDENGTGGIQIELGTLKDKG